MHTFFQFLKPVVVNTGSISLFPKILQGKQNIASYLILYSSHLCNNEPHQSHVFDYQTNSKGIPIITTTEYYKLNNKLLSNFCL